MAKYFFLGLKAGLFFLIATSSLLLATISSELVKILLGSISIISTLIMVMVFKKAFGNSFWLHFIASFLGIPYGCSLFIGVLMASFPKMIGSFLAPLILALGLWGITGIFGATYSE